MVALDNPASVAAAGGHTACGTRRPSTTYLRDGAVQHVSGGRVIG